MSRVRAPCLLGLGLAVAGCLHSPPRPDAAARVGSTDLAYAEFEEFLTAEAGGPAAQLPQEALSELLDRWVEERLLERLAAEGEGAGSVAALLEAEAAEVGAAEVAAWYRAHSGEYARPERVDLEQALLGERAAADEAGRRLRAGEDLDRVIASLSARGLDAQGWRQRAVEERDLPPDLARAVFELQTGQASDVIQADFGFVVFRVEKRVPAGTIALGEVAGEIRRELEQRAAEEARRRLVEEAERRYDAEVFERNLPFTYLGRFASSGT